jgi:ligand-binding sensor protein
MYDRGMVLMVSVARDEITLLFMADRRCGRMTTRRNKEKTIARKRVMRGNPKSIREGKPLHSVCYAQTTDRLAKGLS